MVTGALFPYVRFSIDTIQKEEMSMKASAILGAGFTILGLFLLSGSLAHAEDVNAKGKFEVKSDAGDFSFMFGGRIQVDAAFYDSDITEYNSGTEIRRARLFAAGKMFSDWEYKLQVDFAENNLELKDAYIRYAGLENGKIWVGQFKAPFSLEELTSSKYITFMERSLGNTFSIGRRIGVAYTRKIGSDGTFAIAGFGQSADDGDDGEEGFGAAVRATFLPVKTEDSLLHLGFGLGWEKPEEGLNDTFRYRERIESHLTSNRLVDTGSITNSESVQKYGLEFAYARGPFSLQSEYMVVDVTRKTGFQDVDFDSFYLYGSFFFGEGASRAKAYSSGTFGRIKPKVGAWEIAIRYSTIDLNDLSSVVVPAPGSPVLTGVFGGEQTDITLGVNYYTNSNIRFMANYVMADGEQIDPLTGIVTSDKPNVIQFRAQVDF